MRKQHAHTIEIGATKTSEELAGEIAGGAAKPHTHQVDAYARRTSKAHEDTELEHDHPTASIRTGWSDWWGS